MHDDHSESAGWTPGAGFAVLVAVALAAVVVVLSVMREAEAHALSLTLVAVFAAIGAFAVLAAAFGYARFGTPQPRRLGLEAADHATQPLAVTNGGGRIVYANAAYRTLARAPDGLALSPSDLLEGLAPEVRAPAVLAAAEAAQGRVGMATVDWPTRSTAGRRLQLTVSPAGRGQRVWAFADVASAAPPMPVIPDGDESFRRLQRMVSLLDSAPVGFLAFDGAGAIEFVNAPLAEWLELEPGAGVIEGGLIAVMGAAAAQDTPAAFDLELPTRRGGRLAVRAVVASAPAIPGRPGRGRAVVLPRASLAAVAPAAAEHRFARFFDRAPVAIAGIDRRGRVLRANPPFDRLFGDGEVVGRNLAAAVTDADRAVVTAAITAAATGTAVQPAPVETALAGDAGRSVRIYLSPVADAGDGEVAIAYVLDTTAQRALEAQFAQSQKMQAVGQLAGGVAHDFNNLLTAIIGFADLVLTRFRPSDPFFQDIMAIKQNAHRAAGLVGQLLAFSRRQTMRPERIVLNDVLADLNILLDRLLGERVELRVVHGRDLWPVMADVNQFEQVVVNLAVNARDAMPDGGALTIRSQNVGAAESAAFAGEALPAGDYVMTEISDTGRGMPPEVMEKIFEPFFTTKERGKGTGLGLSTVYGIVKQSGGYITVESAPGQGTTFRVLLPRATEVAVAPEAARPQPATGAAAPPAGRATAPDLTGSAAILLVEDEDAVRAFAARALASRGYTVHQAASGAEALAVMEECGGEIDLVVSDVVMPEMDGPTLMRELRRDRPELRIIFVSGYAEEAFAKNLPENEKFSFLPKPFTLKQLATAVKQALEA